MNTVTTGNVADSAGLITDVTAWAAWFWPPAKRPRRPTEPPGTQAESPAFLKKSGAFCRRCL